MSRLKDFRTVLQRFEQMSGIRVPFGGLFGQARHNHPRQTGGDAFPKRLGLNGNRFHLDVAAEPLLAGAIIFDAKGVGGGEHFVGNQSQTVEVGALVG